MRVGGGCKLGKMDACTAKHGLAVVAGHNPDTGVSGLTLGGGILLSFFLFCSSIPFAFQCWFVSCELLFVCCR